MGERTRRVSGRGWIGVTVGLVLLGALAGCAKTVPAPRVMNPGDLKLVAGGWRGTAYVQGQPAVPVQGFINENGAFWIAPISNPASQVPGTLRLAGGQVFYESAASDGTMTFHEGPTEWTWQWNGKTKNGETVKTELTKSK